MKASEYHVLKQTWTDWIARTYRSPRRTRVLNDSAHPPVTSDCEAESFVVAKSVFVFQFLLTVAHHEIRGVSGK